MTREDYIQEITQQLKNYAENPGTTEADAIIANFADLYTRCDRMEEIINNITSSLRNNGIHVRRP